MPNPIKRKSVRKQLMLNEEVEKRLAAEAERIGISQSNLMAVALDVYFQSKEKMKNIYINPADK